MANDHYKYRIDRKPGKQSGSRTLGYSDSPSKDSLHHFSVENHGNYPGSKRGVASDMHAKSKALKERLKKDKK